MVKTKFLILATSLLISTTGLAKKWNTEAEVCPNCAAYTATGYSAPEEFKAIAEYGAKAPCYSMKLINAAKQVIRSRYGDARIGKGNCALAVRQSLEKAQIWRGGGMGNAKDMIGPMEKAGYKNVYKTGMNPEDAPNGAILIYNKAYNRSRCKGLGSTYGHVEIKENDNSYLYDAKVDKNINEIFEPNCRPLIGVMVMGQKCNTCSQSLKQLCGDQ